MRTAIERWLLIALLGVSSLSRVPGLWRQGTVGIPALVVGLIFSGILIILLYRSSVGAAAVVAVLSAFGAFVAPLVQLVVLPSVRGSPRPESIPVLMSAGISLLVCYCAFDLVMAWTKTPNHFPQPPLRAAD